VKLEALNLSSADPGLAKAQRRFFDEALPAELHLEAFERFDRRAYDAATLTWARESWELRTLDEYRSQVGFSEFLLELTELGCAFDTLTAAVRVVRDEARHVELCRRLVRALGGSDVIPGEPGWVHSDKRESLEVRAVMTVTGSLCIGETLSTALLAATREKTVDPLARHVVTALTRDESFHSQLGWMLLPQLWSVLNAKEKRRVERRIAHGGRRLRELRLRRLGGRAQPVRPPEERRAAAGVRALAGARRAAALPRAGHQGGAPRLTAGPRRSSRGVAWPS
jgi:hypothetical protein